MDKISSAIKCVNCRNIFSNPVLLPCGHSICMSHTNTDCVLCHKCGAEHSNKNYYVNEALAEMIAAQVAAIDFGAEHKEAKKLCSDLSEVMTGIDFLLNDSDHYINESVSELKRRVHLKHEQIKLKVDEETQSILDKLDEYEKICKEDNAKTKKNEMKKLQMEIKKELEQWLSTLNELKFDENKWKSIQGQSKMRIKQLHEALEKLKKEFLINQYETKKSEILLFEKIDIDSLFKPMKAMMQTTTLANNTTDANDSDEFDSDNEIETIKISKNVASIKNMQLRKQLKELKKSKKYQRAQKSLRDSLD